MVTYSVLPHLASLRAVTFFSAYFSSYCGVEIIVCLCNLGYGPIPPALHIVAVLEEKCVFACLMFFSLCWCTMVCVSIKVTITLMFFCPDKPPALSWNVTAEDHKFIISWNPPDVAAGWDFIINYTDCNKEKVRDCNVFQSTI